MREAFKRMFKILLCFSEEGKKPKPLIIGKSTNPRCFKNQNMSNFNHHANKRSWIISSIFTMFLTKWEAKLRKIKDKYCCYLTMFTKFKYKNIKNTKLFFLIPNTTSMLRPLDQNNKRTVNFIYRNFLVSKIFQALDIKTELTISTLTALNIFREPWNMVLQTTIINTFIHSRLTLDHGNPESN